MGNEEENRCLAVGGSYELTKNPTKKKVERGTGSRDYDIVGKRCWGLWL